MMLTRTLFALTLAASFSLACDSKTDDKKAEAKKSDGSKGADKKADAKGDAKGEPAGDAKGEPAADPAAAGKPVETNPKDLFADFTKPDADVMALMTKYENGATFTGKLVTVAAEESGTPVLFVDVDGKAKISIGVADPAPFKAKNLKVGDEITVTCKIGGAMDNLMQVIDCTTK